MPVSKIIPMVTAAAFVAPAFANAATPAEQTGAVRELIARYAPAHAKNFVVETVPAVEGRDAYEVESRDGKIVLRGSGGVAQSSAFYHYLKEFCHAQISWNGENLTLPTTLPAVSEKIRIVSPVKHRLAYNYCTHGYTMPFWGKAEWAREIDRLALHGVNRALIIQGQDAVWQNTFVKFGYTKEEMRRWLCSPVHQPWQFMGNMEGLLPPSQAIVDERAELGRFIVSRCRALGIEPVLQGYYGMIPSGFAKKHPGAKIVPQGGWAGGNRRPDMLNPGDPLFAPIAKTFLEEQKKIYGGDILFLAADPFHEGGTSKGMDRGVVYKQIQDAILAFEPRATLVKQCWQTSNKEMFDAGDKERSLALDLWCDVRPFWKKAHGYDGTPWTWCMLFNFGGNTALEADFPRLAKDFGAALADPGRGRLEGAAIVPEGTRTNPMVYELMTEMAWRGAPADTGLWIRNHLHARYGAKNAAAEAAWATILDTSYAAPQAEGSVNSVITGRPSLDKNLKGRTWAPGSRVPYDNLELAGAWEKLLEAAPTLGAKDTYRYDLADLNRQVLLNLARPVFEKAVDAVNARNVSALKIQRDRFLDLLADLEELAGTRRDWLAGAWVADARAGAGSAADKAYMGKIARMILTTWVENPQTDLADYANREWNGLIGRYYAPRWKLFFDSAAADIAAGKSFDKKAYDKKRCALDLAWVESGGADMAAEPKGDTLAVSGRLFAKYAPILREYHTASRLPITPESVTGAWKYKAEGGEYIRELRADGTVQSYNASGGKLGWFDGYTWTVKRNKVLISNAERTITLERHKPDTLTFASEGFGEAVKTTVRSK